MRPCLRRARSWTPTQPFDARAAWTVTAKRFDKGLRVEAASWKGKLVWCRITAPWEKPQAVNAASTGSGAVAIEASQLTLFALLINGSDGACLAQYSPAPRRSSGSIAAGHRRFSPVNYCVADGSFACDLRLQRVRAYHVWHRNLSSFCGDSLSALSFYRALVSEEWCRTP